MKLHFVWIGKTKEQHCAALVNEYLKRLSRFAPYEVSELKEASGSADETRVMQAESVKLLAAIEKDDFVRRKARKSFQIIINQRGTMLLFRFSNPDKMQLHIYGLCAVG